LCPGEIQDDRPTRITTTSLKKWGVERRKSNGRSHQEKDLALELKWARWLLDNPEPPGGESAREKISLKKKLISTIAGGGKETNVYMRSSNAKT